MLMQEKYLWLLFRGLMSVLSINRGGGYLTRFLLDKDLIKIFLNTVFRQILFP